MIAAIIPSRTLDMTKNATGTDSVSHRKQVKSSLSFFNGLFPGPSNSTERKVASFLKYLMV